MVLIHVELQKLQEIFITRIMHEYVTVSRNNHRNCHSTLGLLSTYIHIWKLCFKPWFLWIEPNLLSIALGLAKARSWYSFIALPLNLFSLRPKLLVSCSILSKKLASGGGTPFCFCHSRNCRQVYILWKCICICMYYFLKMLAFIFFDWLIIFIGFIWKFII